MSRTMYDSTTVSDIPRGATMVAAYDDGIFANIGEARRRFPKAKVVSITVKGRPGSKVADCENGDMSPYSAARWAHNEVRAGRKPTIYCNLSTWGAVQGQVHALGITGKVSYWIAHYNGNRTIPRGAVAVQCFGNPGNSPGHYDISSVGPYWPGVDAPIRRVVPKPRIPKVPPRPPRPPGAPLSAKTKAAWITFARQLLAFFHLKH